MSLLPYTNFQLNMNKFTNSIRFVCASASIHTSKPVSRSYQEWSEQLRKTRFTPVEVLILAKGTTYVVIDPNEENLLLPLTVKRYAALLQDLSKEQGSLVVLIGPGDHRSPPPGVKVNEQGFVIGDGTKPPQNSPTPEGKTSKAGQGSTSLGKLLKSLKGKVLHKHHLGLKGYFATRLTKSLKVVDHRVAISNSTEIGRLVTVWGLYLHQLLGHPLRLSYRQDLWSIRDSVEKIYLQNGVLYTAQYLKTSLFALHKFLAGQALSSTYEVGVAVSLSRSGLPKWIPVRWRHRILSGDKPTIRLVSSLMYLYKVLHTPVKAVSVAPILRSHPPINWADFTEFCHLFLHSHGIRPFKYEFKELLFSSKGGLNITPAGLGICADARSWKLQGEDNELYRFAKAFQIEDVVRTLVDFLSEHSHVFSRRVLYPLTEAGPAKTVKRGKKVVKKKTSLWGGHDAPTSIMGKVHFLLEAAGKVRTIAIGDGITQSLLKPVHDQLFQVLEAFSEVDGTFDQQTAVNRFRDLGFQEIYSLDLSKATDTIPHMLYLSFMSYLYGADQAKAWLGLMVERDFALHVPDGWVVKEGLTAVKYLRGQPMGFYSSWAALAVLHHLIVQYAAERVLSRLGHSPDWWVAGPFPFNNYVVLGDDIVIGCREVAKEYQEFCEINGIDVSTSKSFISGRGFFNFASQSLMGKENVSPASPKEHLLVSSLSQRVSQLRGLVSKGFFGTKAVSVGVLLRGLYHPTTYNVMVKPNLRSGVVSTPIRLGISALSSFSKFPSLKLDSPIRHPWLVALAGTPERVRSIWYNQMRELELSEVSKIADAWYALVRTYFTSARLSRITTMEVVGEYRASLFSSRKEIRSLLLSSTSQGMKRKYRLNELLQRFRVVKVYTGEGGLGQLNAVDILLDTGIMTFPNLVRIHEAEKDTIGPHPAGRLLTPVSEKEWKQISAPTLVQVDLLPSRFEDPNQLLEALAQDFEVFEEMARLPGFYGLRKDIPIQGQTLPFYDIIAQRLDQRTTNSPSWLFAKLSRIYQDFERRQLLGSRLWFKESLPEVKVSEEKS